jgi:RND family efflux transporter MFP subunit
MNRSRRRAWARLLPLAGLAALAALAGGCANTEDQQGAPPAPQVFASTPIVADVTDYEDFPGRLDAVDTVDVRARVTGYVTRTYLGNDAGQIREGREVKKGQVLFEIDPVLYEAAYEKAVADVGTYEAQKRLLDIQYGRDRSLVGRGIAQEDLDKTVALREQAVANIAASRAMVKTAKQNLEWTKVRASLSGRVSRRLVDPGNIVKAEDTLLTTIVSQDPLYAYFDVDENTMLRIRRLMVEGKVKSPHEAELPVFMALSDEKYFTHKGVISFEDNRVDPGTGTLRLRGTFSNPRDPSNPGRPRLMAPNMFVRVRLPIGSAHPAVLVAERALGTDQGQKYVFVVGDDNKVEYRKVRVGGTHLVPVWQRVPGSVVLFRRGLEPLSEVAREDLRPDERVVVNGLQRVREGVVVAPVAEPMIEGVALARGPAEQPAH